MSEIPGHLELKTTEEYLHGLYLMPDVSPDSLRRMSRKQLVTCMRTANIVIAEVIAYEHTPGLPFLADYMQRADAYGDALASLPPNNNH